jgi:hypothetical protein
MADLGAADLERYKAEHAAIEQQIAALTERHRGLAQIISGLETLLGAPEMTARLATEAAPARTLELDTRRGHHANAIRVLRHYGRPLNATQIADVFAEQGIKVKANTLYKALRRHEDSGDIVSLFPGFGLPEWQQPGG